MVVVVVLIDVEVVVEVVVVLIDVEVVVVAVEEVLVVVWQPGQKLMHCITPFRSQ